MPRHLFLPDRVWVGDGLREVRRAEDPEGWLRAAYADEPVVTQVNDGRAVEADEELWPSSSASAPSVVFLMLDLLRVEPGHAVLEIGTGTGWNSALLARRLGSGRVTTVEVDPALSAAAAVRHRRLGVSPRVACGDGAEGFAAGAPYDRIVATCSVRSVPPAWPAQTRPGGVILTPWDSAWCTYGLLRLTVDAHGTASGMFAPYSAFMSLRAHRTDLRIFRDVVREEHVPVESTARVDPEAVAGEDLAARFAVGLLLPSVWHARHEDPDVDGVVSRLWVSDTDATSWAAVDRHEDDRPCTVWQYGPRRLWDEVEAVHAWWAERGRPGPERFGLTVHATGDTHTWLDTPTHPTPPLTRRPGLALTPFRVCGRGFWGVGQGFYGEWWGCRRVSRLRYGARTGFAPRPQ
ncbi:methyltransferase domain-containing protein [Streptomyces sp. BI20]|uniref:methyltransferase domain-containing protein n=1 Tax=Streptomyces sp. BI20 TaxID=3403460 RepID=UPI003C71A919